MAQLADTPLHASGLPAEAAQILLAALQLPELLSGGNGQADQGLLASLAGRVGLRQLQVP